MKKILVLTDLHITAAGGTIIGLDPVARFRRVLDQALRDHPDALHIVVTGDLTHHGTDAEYQQLRAALPALPCGITWMLGNHDNRAAFRAVFPEAPVDDSGFVQTALDIGGVRLICLDTLDPDSAPHHGGALCADRLRFLATRAAGAERVIVFLHHPAFDTGFEGMDRIGLSNQTQVRAALAQVPGLQMVVAGHIHRTISACVDGIPHVTFKSPCHQMPFLLGQAGSAHSVDEPGAYGLLLIQDDGNVVAHTEDVPDSGAAKVQIDAASA